MKIRLLLAMVLLVAAFTMPISAVDSSENNCTFTCSTGWTGHGWAASADACAAGCRAMCVTCVSSEYSGPPLND
ncbi:MAG TPA: hypothetical protein VHC97_10305 [Thermoanaerobaculia bacterium]|jgi:hypothetical protein|nr:hypothetical protein [Thermoanaerobaculia bacterium]